MEQKGQQKTGGEETHRDTKKHRETEGDTKRHKETERDTKRHKETDRDPKRLKETEGNRRQQGAREVGEYMVERIEVYRESERRET